MHRECLGSGILALRISVTNNTNLQQNPPLLEHCQVCYLYTSSCVSLPQCGAAGQNCASQADLSALSNSHCPSMHRHLVSLQHQWVISAV